MPFDNSLKWLHNLVVDAGNSAEVRVERADDIFSAGIVIEQIRDRIRNADVVIAVCTGQNPNVFFELGVADQWHWPVILAEDKKDLPFDIQHYRALIYGGLEPSVLASGITAAIEETLASGRKDKPGRRATDSPPRSRPRVLGQFMSQVHVWGLEREGSFEHFPVDFLFLVQDVASAVQQGTRARAQDYPKREGVLGANAWEVIESAETAGLIQKNFDLESGGWYLAVTEKGQALLDAYDRWQATMANEPGGH